MSEYIWTDKQMTALDQAVVEIKNRITALEKVRPVNLKDVETDIKDLRKKVAQLDTQRRNQKENQARINNELYQIVTKLGENQAKKSFMARLFSK